MKISVTQPNLAQGLSIVSRAIGKSPIMVLQNILLTTEEDQEGRGVLVLTATNLDLGIRYRIPANIIEGGTVTIPARFFTNLVSTIADSEVFMELDEETMTMTIRSDHMVNEIRCIEASEYPPVTEIDKAEAVSFDLKELKTMINQVAFAASTDDNRPVLRGVKFSVLGEELTMAATDGFRIAVKKIKLMDGLDHPISAIIPASALTELSSIAKDNEQTVQMSFCGTNNNQLMFRLEKGELISELIAGQFIDFESIIPKTYKTTILVSRQAFLSACRSAGVYASNGGKNLVKLNIQRTSPDDFGTIVLTTQAESIGNAEFKVDCNIEGEEIAIAFNVRFLQRVLEVLESPNISIRTNSSMSPALIEPCDDSQDYRYVIMPMHFS